MTRFLVTTHIPPWPLRGGSHYRADSVIRGLAELGPVDVFTISDPGDIADAAAAPAYVDRHVLVPRQPLPLSRARRLRWLATGRLPFGLAAFDYTSVTAAFRAWASASYDLAWLGRAEGWVACSGSLASPVVCDLDDLQDLKARRQLEVHRAAHRGHGARDRFRHALDGAVLRRDAERWAKLQRRIAAASRAVVVCSDDDRARSGLPNAVVVPNAYPAPAQALGTPEVGDPPTVSFIGQLAYPPNFDAAEQLVLEVLPHLRRRVPAVEVRVVGRHDGRVEAFAGPGVTITGEVPDLGPELRRADVLVTPIRFGSGTRLKLLEAFAHRIPVVSTTIGAEGLDVADGVHLLLADDPESMAAQCARLLEDSALRLSLTEAAHAHWESRFGYAAVSSVVKALALGTLDASGRP